MIQSRNEQAEAAAKPENRPSKLPRPKPRGFAAMDPARVREISRAGGRAAHAAGTAHEFTSEEARVAGRKGGRASRSSRTEPAAVPVAPDSSVREVEATAASEATESR
jgi:general stress protein YciG